MAQSDVSAICHASAAKQKKKQKMQGKKCEISSDNSVCSQQMQFLSAEQQTNSRPFLQNMPFVCLRVYSETNNH